MYELEESYSKLVYYYCCRRSCVLFTSFCIICTGGLFLLIVIHTGGGRSWRANTVDDNPGVDPTRPSLVASLGSVAASTVVTLPSPRTYVVRREHLAALRQCQHLKPLGRASGTGTDVTNVVLVPGLRRPTVKHPGRRHRSADIV